MDIAQIDDHFSDFGFIISDDLKNVIYYYINNKGIKKLDDEIICNIIDIIIEKNFNTEQIYREAKTEIRREKLNKLMVNEVE